MVVVSLSETIQIEIKMIENVTSVFNQKIFGLVWWKFNSCLISKHKRATVIILLNIHLGMFGDDSDVIDRAEKQKNLNKNLNSSSP